MRHHVRNAMAAFLFAVLLTGVDIGTKWYVLTVIMDPPKRIPILPFFDFVLVYNRGVSFGLLGGLGVWGPLILSGLAIVIIGVFGFGFGVRDIGARCTYSPQLSEARWVTLLIECMTERSRILSLYMLVRIIGRFLTSRIFSSR